MSIEIRERANALSRSLRTDLIKGLKETDLQRHLKSLMERMNPKAHVEVTHGQRELGKDLVMVIQDEFATNITGFVVKCGDITGRTAGDVDDVIHRVNAMFTADERRRLGEIESQVRQAIAHPAEIKASFARLPVNTVIVVLAGDLSNNARQRLEREFPDRLRAILDVVWLVDKFTEHYPEVFFEGEPVEWLDRRIRSLENIDYFLKRDKNLTAYFVDPVVATVELSDQGIGKQLSDIAHRRRVPFATLSQAIKDRQASLLVGDQGSGKTGALAKIALDMYRAAYERQVMLDEKRGRDIEVPVLIDAKHLLSINSADDLAAHACDAAEIRDRVKIGAMLVDKLDLLSHEDRLSALKRARELAHAAGASLIVASRDVETVSVAPAGYKKFEMMPFEIRHAIAMSQRLLGDGTALNTLRDSLDRVKHQIPFSPLSMLLLIDLAERNHEVPASTAELFERFMDAALGRWDEEKGLFALFDYRVKRMFLGELAYAEFLQKDRLEIERPEFEAFVADYVIRHSLKTEGVGTFVAEIERAGVLKLSESSVEFANRPFLDYFAAWHMFHAQDQISDITGELVRLHFDDRWSEVAFYFVGQRTKLTPEIVDRIFAYPEDGLYGNMRKFSIGRLLQAGWFSEASVKSQGIRQAFGLVPDIRSQWLDYTSHRTHHYPKIFGDLYTAWAADSAFRSRFLLDELKAFVSDMAASSDGKDLRLAVPALYVLKNLLPNSELRPLVEKTATAFSESEGLSPEEKVGGVTMLAILEQNDPAVFRSILVHVNKMRQRYPETFRMLLPDSKGFRNKTLNPRKAIRNRKDR